MMIRIALCTSHCAPVPPQIVRVAANLRRARHKSGSRRDGLVRLSSHPVEVEKCRVSVGQILCSISLLVSRVTLFHVQIIQIRISQNHPPWVRPHYRRPTSSGLEAAATEPRARGLGLRHRTCLELAIGHQVEPPVLRAREHVRLQLGVLLAHPRVERLLRRAGATRGRAAGWPSD